MRRSNNLKTNVAIDTQVISIPANRAADDDGGETMAVIKGFSFFHHFILPSPPHQLDRALKAHVIGGADLAAELDAKQAISQAKDCLNDLKHTFLAARERIAADQLKLKLGPNTKQRI